MPIYEYQCATCGHQLEAFQKISDAPLTECPSCHQAALQKLVSAAGFQLKGSGWYVTDYSNKGKAKQEQGADKNPSTTETPAKSTDSAKTTTESSSTETSKKSTQTGE